MRDIDAISGDVIDVALRVHRELGPGLLESVYETVLAGKLAEMGYSVDRQKPIDIEFEGQRFPAASRIDLLIDERLVVEIKCAEALSKGPPEAASYISTPDQTAGRIAAQFLRSNAEGRYPTSC